jgi:hypothetical protein
VHAVVGGDGGEPPGGAHPVARMERHGHGHLLRTYRLGDVVFRAGVAFTAAWIYLRTLFVVAPGTSRTAWLIFAWTGWPLVLLTIAGAVTTTMAYLRER